MGQLYKSFYNCNVLSFYGNYQLYNTELQYYQETTVNYGRKKFYNFDTRVALSAGTELGLLVSVHEDKVPVGLHGSLHDPLVVCSCQ